MKRSKKFGITVFFCSLVLLLAIMVGPLFKANVVQGAEIEGAVSKEYTNVSVERNDTLWQIADEYMNEDYYDHEGFINEVIKINNIKNERIFAGETIIVPIITYQ